MAKVVLIVLFLIPTMLGMAEIIHSIKMLIIGTKGKLEKVLVLVPNNESFCLQLMNEYELYRWNGSRYAKKVIVLDTLLKEENRNECKNIAKKLNFTVCSKNELEDKIFL